ncbi:glycosyltransferase family 4 protein [candidate division KSB1 bacterium]|nr:glycosyltransferase family 4 protein [candidate division KSB1 bacterium]
MNVAIFITRFDFGGAENSTRELANILAENGNEVYVFSKKGRQQRLLSPHVRFRAVNFSKWLLPFSLLYLYVQLTKHKVELIHAHQPSAIRAGSLLGKLSGIPVIVTIHSTTALELSAFTRKTPARIIYVSRHTMERSQWFATLRPKCRYIPNGVTPSDYQASGESGPLVYCSRMDRSHANLLMLLINEVMPQLKLRIPNLTLRMVGDGDWFRQIENWAQRANNLLGAGTVLLDGFRERFLTNGFLVIGVGRVALEALSAGIPVLAVNAHRCGPRISSENYEILSRNNFVDVAAQKPSADLLIESIMEIYRNYQRIIADSQSLRERVNADFCLANIADKIQREYREVISEVKTTRRQKNRHPAR